MKTDSLTGLQNVRYLRETLIRILRSCERRSEPVSVVFLDIDNFKQINDNNGHQYGDEVMHLIGDVIIKISRTEDECFRYGGDEFCLILPDCDEEQARKIYLERLHAEIQKHNNTISLSIGIAQTGPQKYISAEALLRRADELMYQAKHSMK